MMKLTIFLLALCLSVLLLAACGRLDVAIVEPTPVPSSEGEGAGDTVVAGRPNDEPTPGPRPTKTESPPPLETTAPTAVVETPASPQAPAEATEEASGRDPVPPGDQPDPTVTTCTVRLAWPLYLVKRGDTLSRIARDAGATVDELVTANCLVDPDRLYSGQQIRVPRIPPDPPEATATPQPDPWSRYDDDLYQVSFEHPAAWRDVSSDLSTKLAGDDGWVQLIGAGAALDLDSFAYDQAHHKLQPYGTSPTIEPLTLSDGRPARLILPSADQPSSSLQQAMIISPYADPIFFGDNAVNYLMLLADTGHIRDIGATLTMPPPAGDIFIEDFSVSGQDLPGGGKRVTFRWLARNATRGDITSGASHRFPARYPVQSAGQLVVDIGGTIVPDPVMTLRLVNDVTGQQATATAVLSWACDHDYFFQPGPSLCPRDEALVVDGAYQPFERGFMIWLPRPDLAQPSIYVFTNDGRVSLFPDTWSAGEPGPPLGESPPEGLFEPVGGFAKVWREHPSVREDLGWGTARERLYTLSYQAEARESLPGVSYITRPEGTIVRLMDTIWQAYVPGQDPPGTLGGPTAG